MLVKLQLCRTKLQMDLPLNYCFKARMSSKDPSIRSDFSVQLFLTNEQRGANPVMPIILTFGETPAAGRFILVETDSCSPCRNLQKSCFSGIEQIGKWNCWRACPLLKLQVEWRLLLSKGR